MKGALHTAYCRKEITKWEALVTLLDSIRKLIEFSNVFVCQGDSHTGKGEGAGGGEGERKGGEDGKEGGERLGARTKPLLDQTSNKASSSKEPQPPLY